MSFTKYLKYFAVISLALLVITGGFNWFIDPFDIFNSPKIENVNLLKPEFLDHIRLVKAYSLREIRPQSICLGTSRAEVGIDPNYEGWTFQPVYNLGLSGADIYEIFRYFQHSQNIQPLKQVVLCLDLVSFATDGKNKPDFDEGRLSVNTDGHANTLYYMNDVGPGLFSYHATQSSFNTLRQKNGDSFYLENGLRQYSPSYDKNGYYALFSSAEQSLVNTYQPQHFQFDAFSPNSDPFIYYRKILQMAYQKGIDLRMVISPCHARQSELIASDGTWAQNEEWKRSLVRIDEDEANKSGSAPFPLWDFSGYNEFTTENVPRPGDLKTKMNWYWDGSHFKKELGDLILDKIFTFHSMRRAVPDDFGVLLNSGNISQVLDQIRTDRRIYLTTHPQDITDIKSSFK